MQTRKIQAVSALVAATCAFGATSLVVGTPVASAQEAARQAPQQTAEQPSEAAMQALGLAKFYYKKGDFKEAAKLFLRANEISPRAEFLYNAARSNQRAAMLERALELYRQVLKLKAVPVAVAQRSTLAIKEIEAVQMLVRKAHNAGKKAQAEQAAKAVSGSTEKGGTELHGMNEVAVRSPGAKAQPPGAWKRSAALPTLGAGAIVGVIGGALLASWSSDQTVLDEKMAKRDASNKVVGVDLATYTAEQSELNTRASLAWTAIGVGVVAAGAGTWMLLTRPNTQVAVLPTGNGVQLFARF